MFSPEAEKVRAFFADVLRLRAASAGPGAAVCPTRAATDRGRNGVDMRAFKSVAAVALLTGLAAGPVAGAASASAATKVPVSASQVWLKGGDTSVTTAPGIAAVLVSHGIAPIATQPGTEGASLSGGVAVRFTFPVTGGRVNLATLHGTIDHQGGILFVAPGTSKQLEVSDFVINVQQGQLTAEVNGSAKTRVPLLKLSLVHASVHKGWHSVQVSGIVLTLTSTAASALDTTFGTTLFKAGLELGTASTTLRY